MNFNFVCTYKPFTHCGKPKVELYAKNDGGLHPNTEGSNRLKHFSYKLLLICERVNVISKCLIRFLDKW